MHAEYELNTLYLNMVLEELWKPKLLQLRIQDDSRLDGFLIRNVCVQDIAWGIKGHYAVDLVSVLASSIYKTTKTTMDAFGHFGRTMSCKTSFTGEHANGTDVIDVVDCRNDTVDGMREQTNSSP